jgi:hypothetical protein
VKGGYVGIRGGGSECVNNNIGQLAHSRERLSLVDSELRCGPTPGVAAWKYVIVTANLHSEPKPPFMRSVGKSGRNVIQRCQSDLTSCKQKRIVLSVRIRTADEPIPYERVKEAFNSFISSLWWHDLAEQLGNLRWRRAALGLVLSCGWKAHSLAQVFLVYPDCNAVGFNAIVAVDDYGCLSAETGNSSAGSYEADPTSCVQT